jgi:hypothetical protein
VSEAGGERREDGDGGVVLRALLIKILFGGLLVAIAAHYPADSPYLAAREGDANDVVWALARGFDAHAYQKLALEGFTDDFSRNYPLGYPLLIRAVHAVVGNAQTAAVVVSNACALLAALLFALVARLHLRRWRSGRAGSHDEAALVMGNDEAAGRSGRAGLATLLFMTTPGWLVFGTVAYSEGTYLALALAAWWAYLKAEDDGAGSGDPPAPGDASAATDALAPSDALVSTAGQRPRSLGFLLLFSFLACLSVMVRHAGGALLLAVGFLELWRVVRAAPGQRGRSSAEAVAACWAALPLAAYFWWKYTAHDLAGLQERIWNMGVSPLGGLPSLVEMGTSPEHIAQIYATLPILVWLLLRARRVDGRLAVIGFVSLLMLLSYTGTAAQSFLRYSWTLWPAALGALAVRDRGAVWAVAGLLFCLSVLMGAGHVLGTAAL